MTDRSPGYGTAPRGEETDQASAPVFYFVMLLVAGAVALIWEAAIRQPSAYLDPGGGPPRWSATLAALAGALLGFRLAARPRRGHPRDRLPWLLLATCGVAALSAPTLWFAFSMPGLFEASALLVPALAMGLLAATLRTTGFALRHVAGLDVLGPAVRPFPLLALLVVLGTAAAATTVLGMLRTAALMGLSWAVCAHWSPALFAFLDRRRLARARSARLSARVAGLACVALFAASEWWVPVKELQQYGGDVVYARSGEHQRVVIVSGQESFSLFVEDKLRLTTIDDQRYTEALVHPAMAAAPRRTRVAVLGSGDGLTEREILRYPDVDALTVVVVDGALAQLAVTMPWLRRHSEGAMRSGKVTVIEREPIVWLAETDAQFDVMFVDLPDPVGFVQSKSFTRYFYERLGDRLAPDGVAAVQATSPFRSPHTFASIEATIAAAGLSTLPYRAPIPTLGDWGFVLVAHQPVTTPTQVRDDLEFIDQAALARLFHISADLRTDQPGVVSTLHDQPVVEIFANERERM